MCSNRAMRPALLTALLAAPALAQVPCERAKLVAPDPDDDDRYGQAVALSGDFVLGGAFKHGHLGLNSGSAYVHRFDGAAWVLDAELLASDGASQDRFGWAVAADGTRAVVGALEEDEGGSNAGAAYVFVRGPAGWVEEAKLVASDASADDAFGTAVALDGDLALVGANEADGGGAAYVFQRAGGAWVEIARLVAADREAGDGFGTAVSLRDGRAAVGAPLEADAGTAAGAAYVFRDDGTGWLQEQKVVSNDLTANDRFGFALDLDGARLAVGAFNDDTPASSAGSAYVFLRVGTAWTQEDKLVASDGALADLFGYSMALRGDSLAVGARLDDDGGTDAGAVYLFGRDGGDWIQRAKLVADDTAAQDAFGFSLDVDAGRVAVGAWGDDEFDDETGSVYVFAWEASLSTNHCTAAPSSSGASASIGARGSASVAAADFELVVRCAPPNRSGLFFFGSLAIDAPFGDGRRCAGGVTQRLAPVQLTDGAGRASRAIDFQAPPAAGRLVPGSTWSFQFWFRDPPGGAAGFNLSDAVRVTFS